MFIALRVSEGAGQRSSRQSLTLVRHSVAVADEFGHGIIGWLAV